MEGSFKLADALAARKAFEGVACESDIGKRFGEEIDGCADGAEKQDDVNPVGVWPAPDEVDDRQSLEYQAPRVEKVTQKSHGYSSLSSVKIETYHMDRRNLF